jgi:hypothetical protein
MNEQEIVIDGIECVSHRSAVFLGHERNVKPSVEDVAGQATVGNEQPTDQIQRSSL